LAEVNQRAQTVQQQVDKQMVRLLDYTIGEAKAASGVVSTEIVKDVETIKLQIQALSKIQLDPKTLATLQDQLTNISAKITAFPDEVAATTRQSIEPRQIGIDITPPLRVGDRVRHPTFGVGIVTELDRNSALAVIANVNFAG